jgi:hypothetical protein
MTSVCAAKRLLARLLRRQRMGVLTGRAALALMASALAIPLVGTLSSGSHHMPAADDEQARPLDRRGRPRLVHCDSAPDRRGTIGPASNEQRDRASFGSPPRYRDSSD